MEFRDDLQRIAAKKMQGKGRNGGEKKIHSLENEKVRLYTLAKKKKNLK